ncbi:hypothetical protein [Leptospira santarosai]|nr:hypothetical protein [Leptospira santarosai]
MNKNERREYIAETILDGDRICHDNKFLGWYIPRVYRFFPIDTDFESLPEWTGPICDVVLPIMGKEFFTIEPWDDGDISILYNGDLEIIGKRNFRTALVDAHMKISEETNSE